MLVSGHLRSFERYRDYRPKNLARNVRAKIVIATAGTSGISCIGCILLRAFHVRSRATQVVSECIVDMIIADTVTISDPRLA